MILGLDFHGVINTYPQMFSSLGQAVKQSGGSVYVVTGSSIDQGLLYDLGRYGIPYDMILSIVDYHKAKGTVIRYDEKGPWIRDDIWNRTKAELCEVHGIDVLIDDSKVYGQYFTSKTRYLFLEKSKDLEEIRSICYEMLAKGRVSELV